MAKTARTPGGEGSKPITDYFSRQPATRSKQAGQTPTKQQKKVRLSVTDAADFVSSSQLALLPQNQTRMHSSNPESLGRVHLSSPKLPSPSKSSGKRKAKFGVESVPNIENSNSVFVVPRVDSVPPASASLPLTNKVSNNDSSKKSRPSSPSLSSVPGSVSGEEEMNCLRRNLEVSNQSVANWRTQTSSLTDIDVIDVDQPESNGVRGTPSPYQTHTPPSPASDTAEKTQQLIAEIRARAFAEARSSPTETKPFKETLSDSDSDDLQPLEIKVKGKRKADGTSTAPMPATTMRYNTRSTNGQVSLSKSNLASPLLQSESKKSASKKNPFIALLKEKRDEERSGRSTVDYLKAAEIANIKDRMLFEMDDEDGLDLPTGSQKTSSGKEMDDFKVDLDDSDRKRLLGDQSAEIQGILDEDLKNRSADELQQSRVGVTFWRREIGDDDASMTLEPILDFGNGSQQPIICMLHNAFQSSDDVRLVSILNSGLLSTLNLENCAGMINHLCYVALSPKYGEVGFAAFKALLNVWTMPCGHTPGITLQSVLNAVSGLGAKFELLNLPGNKGPNMDEKRRAKFVFRMVKMIDSSARPRLLNLTDIPGVVLVLLAISLDPSTSDILQNEITVTLNTTLESIADPNVVADIEPVICTTILSYISNVDPVNISHVVTLLAGCVGRGVRIARWVARSVLLSKTQVTEPEYCHTPPVDDLSVILVQGASTPCQAFQVHRATDYVEMGYYVQILAVALTDIPSYIPQEIAAIAALKAKRNVGSSPSKDKLDTPFQRLETCMTFVQSKINDQGTHIERSRTKAALHHLAMRIHYQVKAGTKVNRPANIRQYLNRGNGKFAA